MADPIDGEITIGDFTVVIQAAEEEEPAKPERAEILRYNGDDTVVIFPDTLTIPADGGTTYPVGTIGANVFEGSEAVVTEVHVGQFVSWIRPNAFTSMDSIRRVYFSGWPPFIEQDSDQIRGLGDTSMVTLYLQPAAGQNMDDFLWQWYWDSNVNEPHTYNDYPVVLLASPTGLTTQVGVSGWAAGINLDTFSMMSTRFSHLPVITTNELNGEDADITVKLGVQFLTGDFSAWAATLESSDFVWQQRPSGEGADFGAIPKSNFSVDALGDIVPGEGDSTDGLTKVEDSDFGSGPVTLLSATAGNGQGNYTLPLEFSLEVPGDTRSGNYIASLTLTLSIAP